MAVVSLRRQGQRGVDGLVIPEAYHLHTSPDGIHWTCDGAFSKPILPYLYGRFYPQTGIGDTSRFWWDPYRHKYIGDVKFVLPGTIRCRGMMESDDLEHWTRPHPTFAARNPGSPNLWPHGVPLRRHVYRRALDLRAGAPDRQSLHGCGAGLPAAMANTGRA